MIQSVLHRPTQLKMCPGFLLLLDDFLNESEKKSDPGRQAVCSLLSGSWCCLGRSVSCTLGLPSSSAEQEGQETSEQDQLAPDRTHRGVGRTPAAQPCHPPGFFLIHSNLANVYLCNKDSP